MSSLSILNVFLLLFLYSQLLIKGYRELKKSFDKDKKVEENIQRIKGLL
jgi:hypothetical protein